MFMSPVLVSPQTPSHSLDESHYEQSRNTRESKSARLKVVLFGHFGSSNFGNETTLKAMLWNVRQFMPRARISCICGAPEAVTDRYKIPADPISGVVLRVWDLQNPVAKMARKICIGIPSELYRWLRGIKMLLNANMLIVVGTGLLTDAFGIRGWGPYSVFKWSVIARLCGCRVMFVSVGAGPLDSAWGRLLVKSALSLANFRSFRDKATLDYLRGIGFKGKGECIYPDLAFSLPAVPSPVARVRRRVVGLGLMTYTGMYGVQKTTTAQYDAYLETLLVFAEWLLQNDFDLRFLIGDLADTETVSNFHSRLRKHSLNYDDFRVFADPIVSAEELMSQIAETDYVVATRFHNILLALVLNKPSIGISFHHKCSSLMSHMGVSEYCQDINRLSVERLIEQFRDLEKNAEKLKALIKHKTEESRKALDEQYDCIFTKNIT